MELDMTKKQNEALDFFAVNHFLVVEAPRGSGKTLMLRKLVGKNADKKIAVRCPSFRFFKDQYRDFPNCFYVDGITGIYRPYDILLGDEVYIEPIQGVSTACAFTKPYVGLRWTTNDIEAFDKERLKNFKREMPEYIYQREFGQYEK